MSAVDANGSSSLQQLAQLETIVPGPDGPGLSPAAGTLATMDSGGWVGRRLGSEGRYEIVSLIGVGGMGEVYLAKNHTLAGMSVAVKRPTDRLLSTPGLRDRFSQEFEALTRLDHPNVCGILDAGRHEDVPYAVLRYLGGGSLCEKYFGTSPGEGDRTLQGLFGWLHSIAAALDYIHSRGYVHRDVKPDNILFDDHGTPCLGDFGIVSVTGLPGADSELDASLGTPGYIAPEASDSDSLDGRADQYALAAVAYVFLTGREPFPGDSPDAIRRAQLKGRLKAAHRFNRSLPRRASKLIRRALSVRPNNRFASCTQFADAMFATSHAPTGRKSKARLLVTAVAVGGAVAFLGGFTWPELQSQTPVEVQREEPSQGDLAIGLQRARQWIDAGELQEALDELNRLAERFPDSPDLLEERGHVLLGLDHAAEAIDQFRKATRLEPRASRYADLATAQWSLKRYEDAITSFTSAIDSPGDTDEPTIANWFSLRGHAHFELGHDAQALADCREAAALDPQNQQYRDNVATTQARLGSTSP